MSSGIQSLLKTEREASEIINEARKYRVERLKSAKADAQKEIDDYKKVKEAELKDYEKEQEGLVESIDKGAAEEVEKKVADLKKKLSEKKSGAVKLVVEATINPKPELPINAAV